MAIAEHRVSRRALLAAACAAPVLVRHPGLDPGSTFSSPAPQDRGIPDPPDPIRGRNDEGNDNQAFAVTKWDQALAAFRRAEAALAAGAGADDDLFDRLLGRLNRALARLLRVPAPNLPALAHKLDLLIAHQVWELRYAEASMTALKRDAHRLAQQAN